MSSGLIVSLVLAVALAAFIWFIVANTPKPNVWNGETEGQVPEPTPTRDTEGLGTFEAAEVKVEPVAADPVIEAVADVAATAPAVKKLRKPRAPKVTEADIAEATSTEAAPVPAVEPAPAKKPRASKAAKSSDGSSTSN